MNYMRYENLRVSLNSISNKMRTLSIIKDSISNKMRTLSIIKGRKSINSIVLRFFY